MVMEDPIPDQSTLLYLFGEMVPAQRPLRPIRTERKKVLMQDMTGHDLKILLTVVRAYDVPVRADSDPINHPQRGHGDKKQGNIHEKVFHSFCLPHGRPRCTSFPSPPSSWDFLQRSAAVNN